MVMGGFVPIVPKTWREKFEKTNEFPKFNFESFYADIMDNICRERDIILNNEYGIGSNGTRSEQETYFNE